ncbi:MAG: flavodoxin family protein [Candidatus Methanomethylophilaceae archaeon]
MAKIVVVLTSPRKGANSETLAMKIADGAKDNGNEVEVFRLSDLEINGCKACMGCKKTGNCVQKDGIKGVLEAIKAADGVVLTAPVYFGQPLAQYRSLEDRMFSFIDGEFKPFIAPGKKLAVVGTSGADPVACGTVAEQIAGRLGGFFKFETIGTVSMNGCNPPNVAAGNADKLAEAYAIGKKF